MNLDKAPPAPQDGATGEAAPPQWAQMRERGAAWGPLLLAYVYKLCGRTICLAVMAPVVFFFFLTGAPQRRASRAYLSRLWARQKRSKRPNLWHSFKHFMAFGVALVDRFGAWVGDVARQDIERIDDPLLERMRDDPRGAMILSAHIGSIDIARALASRHQRRPVNVVLHIPHAKQFDRAVAKFAPNSQVRLISAVDFNVGTAMSLSAAVERGEWVVFMGDRTPVSGGERTASADFLGAPARWPLGPFSLLRALKCPAYVLVCYRLGKSRRVHFSQLADTADFEAADRRRVIPALIANYVAILENILIDAPYQWFNFYHFWSEGQEASKS